MDKNFEGIFIALTTPFVDDEVSPALAAENVKKYNGTGVSGYVAVGSTGESVSLTDKESVGIIEAVVEAAGPGKTVIAGAARESTRRTVEFANNCADAGAQAALVRAPCYFKSKMTSEALRSHFLAVAEGSRIPVIIYNIPQNVGFPLDSGLIVELAAHQNIIGLKESAGSLPMLGEIMAAVRPGFKYFLGSGHVLLPGFMMGACGAILAVANAAPELCCEIFALFRKGDTARARAKQLALIPLNKALTEKYGIAGVKYAQDLRGYYGGIPRSPLLALKESEKAVVSALMREPGLIPE